MVAIGSSPPYAVRFLLVKSYGVEAAILKGSGLTPPTPCVTRLFSLSSRLLFTFWVAPENEFAKRQLRSSTCFNAGFSGSPKRLPRSSPQSRPDPVHNPGVIDGLVPVVTPAGAVLHAGEPRSGSDSVPTVERSDPCRDPTEWAGAGDRFP